MRPILEIPPDTLFTDCDFNPLYELRFRNRLAVAGARITIVERKLLQMHRARLGSPDYFLCAPRKVYF